MRRRNHHDWCDERQQWGTRTKDAGNPIRIGAQYPSAVKRNTDTPWQIAPDGYTTFMGSRVGGYWGIIFSDTGPVRPYQSDRREPASPRQAEPRAGRTHTSPALLENNHAALSSRAMEANTVMALISTGTPGFGRFCKWSGAATKECR